MIDTAKVTGRRELHFNSQDDLFSEIARIAAAEKAGTLKRLGNWTPGQALGHLSAWTNYSYDGYPPQLKAPWFIKAILKMMKKKFLRGPLPVGRHIPGIPGGTLAIEVITIEEGTARLKKSWERLRKSPPTQPNIVFGPMTHEEWMSLHMRHAELHLSFFVVS